MMKALLKNRAEQLTAEMHDLGLKHLQASARGSSISVYSQYEGSRVNRCRFNQLTKQLYALDMANHRGVWESTPFTGTVDELFKMVVTQFEWTLVDY
jgi:hypothetical protein